MLSTSIPTGTLDLGRLAEPALPLPAELDYHAWAALAPELGRLVRWSHWLLGDWLLYGDARYGERAAQAEAATGLDYQTLANARWVAKAIPPARRVAALSWSHHVEVAALPADEQVTLLALATPDQAAGETEPRLSVRDLRDVVKLHKTGASLTAEQAYLARAAVTIETLARQLPTTAAPWQILGELETVIHAAVVWLSVGSRTDDDSAASR